MRFFVKAYRADGLGHVSVMRAKGFFGLMKMDTLIIVPKEKDLPLYSYDRIYAMGLRAFCLPQVQIFAAQNRVGSALFGYRIPLSISSSLFERSMIFSMYRLFCTTRRMGSLSCLGFFALSFFAKAYHAPFCHSLYHMQACKSNATYPKS